MKIFIGADHGGFELKKRLIIFLSNLGNEVKDMGAFELNPEDDYPDFIIPVAEKIANDDQSLGIVIGRSGNGEAIAANKVKGIRAAVCISIEHARKARQDNNANILSIPADYLDTEQAEKITEAFISTEFSNLNRHNRRIEKIKLLEQKLSP